MFWRLVLPLSGLLSFAAITAHSSRSCSGRYLWWAGIQLDSQPGEPEPEVCYTETGSLYFESRWVDPGPLQTLLMLSALPAFLLDRIIVRSLGGMGVSQVSSFMVSMPLLIFAWYFGVGNLVDRWISKRRRLAIARAHNPS